MKNKHFVSSSHSSEKVLLLGKHNLESKYKTSGHGYILTPHPQHREKFQVSMLYVMQRSEPIVISAKLTFRHKIMNQGNSMHLFWRFDFEQLLS